MGSERKPGKEPSLTTDKGRGIGKPFRWSRSPWPRIVRAECVQQLLEVQQPRAVGATERGRERENEASTYARRLLDSGSSFLGRLARSECTGSTGIFLEARARSSN